MDVPFYLAIFVILATLAFVLSYIDSEVVPLNGRGCLTWHMFAAGLVFLAFAFVLAVIVLYRWRPHL